VPDEYDVQLAVSAYDKLDTGGDEDKAAPGAGKAPKGKAPAKDKAADKEAEKPEEGERL
jgi:hypothetical protein